MTVTVDEQRPTTITGWLRDRRIMRFEVGVIAAFHTLVALVLTFAGSVRTPSTVVILGLVPQAVWVGWFTVAATLAWTVVAVATPNTRAVMWSVVLPLTVAWAWGFGVAVTQGTGNPLGLILWCTVLAWWLTLCVRTWLGGDEARWGGS